MSVHVRPYRAGGWELDIRLTLPDGTKHRDRLKSPVASKSGSRQWGEAREREILAGGIVKRKAPAPTLAAFAPVFLERAKADRQKPSTIQSKKAILDTHLIPLLGSRRLDSITERDVDAIKSRLAKRSPKTVNNVLTTLSGMLKLAKVDGPALGLFRVPRGQAAFYDFGEYDSLVEAARRVGPEAVLIVLLGGRAGLRAGEMLGLRWQDVDFPRRILTVEQSAWKGQVTAPKGGKIRHVPFAGPLADALVRSLADALASAKHPRGERVLCDWTYKLLRARAMSAGRLAGVVKPRPLHVLRHTFCSHLAMRGVPVRTIQELAGHEQLSTTLRYMHLSRGASGDAILALEDPAPGRHRGDGEEARAEALGNQ